LDQIELLGFVAAALERQGIPYAVTGSHASFAYGEHRFTNDIDVVIRLTPAQLPGLLSEFPSEEFYVSDLGAAQAAAHGGQFNVIHPESGLKVDLIVPREPEWPDQLQRRVRLPTQGGSDVWFIAPEDLILRKMGFYRQGESEKHLRDIASMLKIQGERIDRKYIEQWATTLGLQSIWQAILRRLSS
jgi:predicted nucleotidyltransferase